MPTMTWALSSNPQLATTSDKAGKRNAVNELQAPCTIDRM
uniref:Uncharacterized protein n=1 Tax=Globisporangium ultimum (strain ATCC 200006 / CBS 805.95 / DAOM BR144) TaxID=431595 RepID=K3WWG9_GLOUD